MVSGLVSGRSPRFLACKKVLAFPCSSLQLGHRKLPITSLVLRKPGEQSEDPLGQVGLFSPRGFLVGRGAGSQLACGGGRWAGAGSGGGGDRYAYPGITPTTVTPLLLELLRASVSPFAKWE